jgi:hypothetical protein
MLFFIIRIYVLKTKTKSYFIKRDRR